MAATISSPVGHSLHVMLHGRKQMNTGHCPLYTPLRSLLYIRTMFCNLEKLGTNNENYAYAYIIDRKANVPSLYKLKNYTMRMETKIHY